MSTILKNLNNPILIYLSLSLITCSQQIEGHQTAVKQNVSAKLVQSTTTDIPEPVQSILKHYPQVSHFKDNYLWFKDGSKLIYDDGKQKSVDDLLNQPDIEDMFTYRYGDWDSKNIIRDFDPGRIRNEDFFKKIYGQSKDAVSNQLKSVSWCPKLIGQTIRITSVNGLNKIVDSLSKELDNHPEFKEYLKNIGGTFNWRKISGTNRQSMHSFGMTIDINTGYSNYWQWDCNCKDEHKSLSYKNKIPLKLVEIFERYGFIWGGKWYHYDTMHFEYRPELLNA